MSTVMLRNHNEVFSNIEEVGDTYTGEAIAVARELAGRYRDLITVAHVDRFDGLVVLGPTSYGWRFTTPICGYGGTGPMASAEILEIFGFGPKEELFRELNHGGDKAKASFSKQ